MKIECGTLLEALNTVDGIIQFGHTPGESAPNDCALDRLRAMLASLAPQPGAAAPAKSDRNVDAVRQKLAARSAVGLAKYGVTTEREDLSRADWLRHLQEELMDAAVYIEAALATPEPAKRTEVDATTFEPLLRYWRDFCTPEFDKCANDLVAHLAASGTSASEGTHSEHAADAARWREVARRFDASKTSASERVLEDLGLSSDDASRPLEWIIDRARQVDDVRDAPAGAPVSTSVERCANVGYPNA